MHLNCSIDCCYVFIELHQYNILVHLIYFGPLWSIWSILVHFSPNQTIWVYFSLFNPLWFIPMWFISNHLGHFDPLGPLWSISVHFNDALRGKVYVEKWVVWVTIMVHSQYNCHNVSKFLIKLLFILWYK